MSEDRPKGSAPIPKQELLIKLLGMTGSANDGEALVALRKATSLLDSAGWTWERLVRAKITVVADPFAQIKTPPAADKIDEENINSPSRRPSAPTRCTSPPPPPRPRPTPAAQPASRPAPNPAAMPNSPIGGFSAGATTRSWSAGAAKPAPKNYSIKPNRYEGYCFCCGTLVGQQGGFIFEPSKHNPSAVSKWQIICGPCNQGAHIPISPVPRQKVNHNASTNQL